MLAQNHLTLQLVRLKPTDEWVNDGQGLAFIFPKGGVGKYVSSSVTQRLGPGDVFVLNPSAAGKLCVNPNGEIVFWYFSLCLEHLFPLFATNEIPLLQSVTDGFRTTKFYPASGCLAAECHRLLGVVPPQFNLDHRGQLLRVVAAILSGEFKDAHAQRVGFVRAEEHMIQVFEKLSMADLLTLSVGEMAARFGCSRRHLNRLFHQHFGFSVAALRMEMRLLRAVALLRDPDTKVINVAEQCGFNHLGLFNTCFKRRFGASPGQWRKMSTATESKSRGLVAGERDCPLRTNGLCPWTGKPDDCNPAVLKASQNNGQERPGAPRPTDPRRLTVANPQASQPKTSVQIRL